MSEEKKFTEKDLHELLKPLRDKIEELENELDQDPEPPYNWRDDRD